MVYFSGIASKAKEIAGLIASSSEFLWRSAVCVGVVRYWNWKVRVLSMDFFAPDQHFGVRKIFSVICHFAPVVN